ncbi:hypothetical protein ATY30_15275 [Sinorhizobium americanum]|uniref:hypothetical protein n=2 Tax=Sinorhizobium TaxID=28105 RepID=UPI000BE8ADC0|nr:hypothetical protein [Sinorhizobium americanum]PDT52835.1 hypothetical protein CO664_10780 [Sinorhizobium sp. NG07B]POH29006.1 hypothetical protein ATY30_15275 [Sinorhizobium americanum]
MSKTISDPLAPATWPRWPVGPEGRSLMLSMTRFQADILQTALRGQIEALTFMQSRSEQHLQLWEELLASDYARDGFDLYCAFWRNAFQDYSDEAERFTRMGAELATQTAKRVSDEQEELTEKVARQMVM